MTDTFRKEYRQLTDDESADMQNIKQLAEALEIYLIKYPSREMSLAITNLEQSVMWSMKAITK